MKRAKRILSIGLISGILIIGYALPVWASCTVHTYSINGQLISCTTCCMGTFCNTTCI